MVWGTFSTFAHLTEGGGYSYLGNVYIEPRHFKRGQTDLRRHLCIHFQRCSIELGIGSRDKKSVRLIADQIFMSQKLDMNMFEITSWDFNFNKNNDGLRVLIVLKRKFISEIMTTYFPSFLLLATTLATTFFKPFFFEAALSVNLTTMLVMTTIFISKMESLPPTSNIKMLDFWLIFCQIIPFAEVVLLTAMEYQRGDNNDVPLNPSRVNVLPNCKDEIDIQAEDIHEKINLIFSILSVPKLKTLGKFLHASPS